MDFDRELKRATLPLAVLSLMSAEELYGYELATRLAERSDGALAVAEGTLYPLLRRLESHGLLEARWVPTAEGVPPRRYYRLSASGREEFTRLSAGWREFAQIVDRFLEEGRDDVIHIG